MATNVEIYRRLVAAFNEGGVEAVLDFFAEDVEIYDPDLPGTAPTAAATASRRARASC